MRKVFLSLLFVLSISVGSVWAMDTYQIDPGHTTLGFSVKHMTVSNVTGGFDKFAGSIKYDPKDLDNSKIDLTIQVVTINTRNEKRDAHLRTADFFDVVKYPEIKFVSKKITASEIVGDLTIKGVTKEVSVPATISGPVKGMMGPVIGINGALTINRQDYGVSFNQTLDQGGLAVGNDVNINISIEASMPEPAVAAKTTDTK